MTPKEKAQFLFKMFRPFTLSNASTKDISIKCVDEIIKANPTNWDEGPESTMPYWQQVKAELKKM